MSSSIDRDVVDQMAKLAHLALEPEEAESLAADLQKILGYVDQLQQADVANAPPTSHVDLLSALGTRPDEPHVSLSHEAALANAPRSAEGGFAVPAFVDEG